MADPAIQRIKIVVTHVETEGPFLKVWGQIDRNSVHYVEQLLAGVQPQFDHGVGKLSLDQLPIGALIGAKYKDNKYYRAKIVSTNIKSYCNKTFAEVLLVDYGYKDLIRIDNLRSLQSLPTSLITLPILATAFILGGVYNLSCDLDDLAGWKEEIFQILHKELCFHEVFCQLITQATHYYLVRLFSENNVDLNELFVNRRLLQPISVPAQHAVLINMNMQKKSSAANAAQINGNAHNSEIINYKTEILEPNQIYPVYVSFVTEGPSHFSIQLEQSEQNLVQLMKDINNIDLSLVPFEERPLPGRNCLARCQEDGNICRAVVTNEVDNQLKVYYVDFGNFETLSVDRLYQIPFKYVLPKVMAIRMSLNGVDKSTVTMDMRLAFKAFVNNRLLHMKVLPSNQKGIIPKCELWDPESRSQALEVILRAAQHAYPEPLLLTRGFSQAVKVSYVYSCNRFYVQLSSKEPELVKLMQELQSACKTNDFVQHIKLGLPCCALFESDELWYRSEIVDIIDKASVKVRYIDYGNEEVISTAHLKVIEGELLTVLRPQAIECCLFGYQNMEPDDSRDAILEGLILEQRFTMKVNEMFGKKALVELIDAQNYNVASLLLDKIATAKSTVSPMLVQAGNTLEHRKSFEASDNNNYNNKGQQRKPERTWNNKNDGNKNEKTNERSWRNGTRESPRQNDSSTNRGSDSSWRQTNNNNNWNDNQQKNTNNSNNNGPTWSSPVNENVPSAANVGWGETSPVHESYESDKFKNDSFGGRRKYDESSRRQRDGFKNDFKKDGSEKSSSGSEKSFRKSSKPKVRIEYNSENRFNKKSSSNFGGGGDSWNTNKVVAPSLTAIDAAAFSAKFKDLDVVDTKSAITISWFQNPTKFYCQLKKNEYEFQSLVKDIQEFYKKRQPENIEKGPVVGQFPEDNVLYRAEILDHIGSQYKVLYIDYGNIAIINNVWPIDKKFMDLPAQAICCSLNGIRPLGDTWQDLSNFSSIFGKDNFVATFLHKKDEKTYVQLADNDADITELLIKSNLVAPLLTTQQVSSSCDIDVPLLLSQQFRITLKSVKNLNDIIVAFDESGITLNCKAHNLSTATETFPDILKNYLEKTLIIYVDNIIDDKILEVTFYDNCGTKIKILNPDDGAFDTVYQLCPLLITNSKMECYISHANETSVFIQPNKFVELIEAFLERFSVFYDNDKTDEKFVPVLEYVYAVHSSDGNWYRGRIDQIENEHVTVFYVDYGNNETVPLNAVKELKSEFYDQQMFCIEVNTTKPLEKLFKDVLAVMNYGENGWEATMEILPSAEAAPEIESVVEILPEPISEIPVIEEQKIVESVIEEEEEIKNDVIIEEAISEEQPDKTEILSMKGSPIIVSHIDSPTQFYVQFPEALARLEDLQENLQKIAIELPVLENISVGVLCAAPYSADHLWYRAEVLDVDTDITTVRFVDFGNTDVIMNNTTEIKTLPSNLLTLAVFATRCSLKVKPMEEEWNQQAIELFETFADSDQISIEFIIQDEKTNIVELYVDGKNAKDALIIQNLAVSCEIIAESSKSTCFVSHLNSPSEFWIQMENCVDQLEGIAEKLSEAEQFPELEDFTPGNLCVALFADDQMWYRARILSNTVGGIELLFIDYGNSSISTSLRQLPEDLVLISPMAEKCCLQKPEGILYWSKEAQEKFAEISAEGVTIFQVKKLAKEESTMVELRLDGNNILPVVLPQCLDGTVKNFNSLKDFTIDIDGVLHETMNLEELPGEEWNDDSNVKFLQFYAEGTIFQVELLPENKCVRLYKNWSDIRPQLGGTNKINLNVTNIQENNVETDEQSEAILDKLENIQEIKSVEIEKELIMEIPEIPTNDKITPDIDVTKVSEDSEQIKETNRDVVITEEIAQIPEIPNDEITADIDVAINKENVEIPEIPINDKITPDTDVTKISEDSEQIEETNRDVVINKENVQIPEIPIDEITADIDAVKIAEEPEKINKETVDVDVAINKEVVEIPEISNVVIIKDIDVAKISEESDKQINNKETGDVSINAEEINNLNTDDDQNNHSILPIEIENRKEVVEFSTCDIKEPDDDTNDKEPEDDIAEKTIDLPPDEEEDSKEDNVEENMEISAESSELESPIKKDKITDTDDVKVDAENTLPSFESSEIEEIPKIQHVHHSRLSHDEKILPAVASRPQSPVTE